MSSLVTTPPLGSKENPHPIIPHTKDRTIGHYYIHNGELRRQVNSKGRKNGKLGQSISYQLERGKSEKEKERKRNWSKNNPEYIKEWYQDNKEDHDKKSKEYYENNKETILEQRKGYNETRGRELRLIREQKMTRKEFIEYLIKACNHSHNRRVKKGRKFNNEPNITVEYILELIEKQENKCRFTGVELIWKVKSGNFRASIDRIDSDKTYMKGNIQLICVWANKAKSDLTDEEFIKLCKMVGENN
jgi:hypothetical protein